MSSNSQRLFAITLFLACTSVLGGCKEIARASLRGAFEKVGAKAVKGSSDEQLRDMFASANAACPVQMDAFTTLEGVKMLDDRRVEYRYVMNDAATQIASRLDKRAMKKAAVDHIKGNPMAVAIAERDLVVEHIYEDSAGNHVFSFIINRAVLEGDLEPFGTEQSNPFDVTTVKASGNGEAVDQPEDEAVEEAAEEAPDEAAEEVIEEPKKEKPPLPKPFQRPRRTRDNPAGVQTNPYFRET
jgi:hypothetical protein